MAERHERRLRAADLFKLRRALAPWRLPDFADSVCPADDYGGRLFSGTHGMNITHVVENLNRGGLERMVIDLVKLQRQQGHHCQVVCLFELGSLAPELMTIGVPVNACGKRSGLDFRAVSRLRKLIRTHATDVLHTHNAVAHYYAVLATLGIHLRRTINTRHSMFGARLSAPNDHGSIVSQKLDRRERIYRLAVASTDAVVTVCEAARRHAIELGIVTAEKCFVVPNGIHVDSFQTGSIAMRERMLEMLKFPAQSRIIGSVGRLTRLKDQAGLIRAYRRVHEQQPDAVLVFIGDGELLTELQECVVVEGVADSVHFLGDRSDVRELLQGLDIFALSSLSEGYSMALLEASAVALPIVATDVGGNGEIVRDGATGLLVPPGNPEAMAGALVRLLEQPQRARALGDAARAWVEAKGSLESMAASYANLYRTVSA
jgi:glycosyltransferase involved in cell wall biosynthesis